MDFVIVRSKWICGNPSINVNKDNCLGSGETQMCNEEGYMCCLGQISNQVGVKNLGRSLTPFSIASTDKDLLVGLLIDRPCSNTLLALKAMSINDDLITTLTEKEALLIDLFVEYGHTITFVD